MGFGEEFLRFVERVRAPVLLAASRLVGRPDLPRVLKRVLLNQWHVVDATSELLEAAADASRGTPLAEYFDRKLSDEDGHDEVAHRDLLRLGVDMSEPADPNIIAMVGSQYFHINHGFAASFLGYIGLLESTVPSDEDIERLEVAARIPVGSLKCARLHAHADESHTKYLLGVLDALPSHLHAGVLANAAHSAFFQTMALESLLRLPDETRATP